MTPKVLLFAGSNRSGSFNVTLAQAAQKVLTEMDAQTTMISLADYPLPILDEDLHKEKGTPDSAIKLARLFVAHDALFIAAPEYNSSITPLLKNTLDWVSVTKSEGKPYAGLTVGLGAASNGALGGIRGLYHVRSVLMNVGAQVVTEQAAISGAKDAFGEDGLPTNNRQLSMLKSTCRALLDFATTGRSAAHP